VATRTADNAPEGAASAIPDVDPDRKKSISADLSSARAVWLRQRLWRVERYCSTGNVGHLDLALPGTERRQPFLTPYDRPRVVTGRQWPRRVGVHRATARLCDVIARRPSLRLPLTLLHAQVDVLPFQIEPALAMLGQSRRVLVADDVGLGKTVQAGLLAAELVRRCWPIRILALVPATLQSQWADELQQRFGLSVGILDAAGVAARVRDGAARVSPWAEPGVWLTSIDFVKQPHIFAALPWLPWDLIIVDEAHDVSGDSARHRAADAIARHARRVLLLIATPHSGDSVRFDRLRDLGRIPGLAHDDLLIFRRRRADAGLAADCHVHWHALSIVAEHAALFDTLLQFERMIARRAAQSTPLLLLAVLRKRALSTLRAFEISVRRRLHFLLGRERPREPWTQARLPFQEDAFGDEEDAALCSDTGVEPERERAWLERLLRLAVVGRDEKIRRLRTLLARTREPVVVFTEFRHSLEVLAQTLQPTHRVSVMHGGQTLNEHRDALRQFRAGAAPVLIATDVAGQGLNLQDAARWVICLEVPWNPVRLEQRLGRVDRIGQRRRTHMTVLTMRHEAESLVVAKLARRVLAARHAIGADALASSGPPSLLRLASSIFQNEPLEPAAPVLPPARQGAFFRTARAAAAVITRRRRLAHGWRGPAIRSPRAWCAAIPSASEPVLVTVSVPIVDGAGSELERVVLLLRVADLAPLRNARSLEALVQMAARGRIRRIARLLRAGLPHRMAMEQAIARSTAQHDAERGSPHLFLSDASRSRGAQNLQLRLDADDRIVASRLSALRAGADGVGCGTPAIEAVLPERRRTCRV
jgi:superfamily II DNA or RNA helicase